MSALKYFTLTVFELQPEPAAIAPLLIRTQLYKARPNFLQDQNTGSANETGLLDFRAADLLPRGY